MKCPVGTFPSIRVIRGRLSRNQHRAQKQDRTRNFFVKRVEKTTDDRPARSPCYPKWLTLILRCDRPVVGPGAVPTPLPALGLTAICRNSPQLLVHPKRFLTVAQARGLRSHTPVGVKRS